ncbi:unnamed protein product [Polarella glacialis]|uniref:Uncharacterized protein n=1 Tax=Polarella glacialis TaxID=89957 RepID=A0A813H6D0_POLGL|nr:unnamed protein product [Polarella glacialis]CAE8633136.1 unnamed protein product [Polarella glacialis]
MVVGWLLLGLCVGWLVGRSVGWLVGLCLLFVSDVSFFDFALMRFVVEDVRLLANAGCYLLYVAACVVVCLFVCLFVCFFDWLYVCCRRISVVALYCSNECVF